MQYTQQLPIYQVDAFTSIRFKGNPAAIVPLQTWLTDDIMQAIAAENNLSETAFFVPEENGFRLRWFTPTTEVRFCGHATLATAHTLYAHLNYTAPEIQFFTKSGLFTVVKQGELYLMNFPVDHIVACEPPLLIQESLGNVKILDCYKGLDDYLVIIESQAQLKALKPDFRLLTQVLSRGVIVSARGEDTDFVSRCFFPQSGIDEDPVTGSAHTTLTPYWAQQLGKNNLTAQQISTRGGYLECTLNAERVIVCGKAVTFLIGEFFI
ncbi:MAG: PhzF family phenazine biosynthesis protein [Saprospiraceae bacterium]|nr:PhzF family phenazine biosynthesis protein [Saprospiraceae bacterium]